jgi:transposase
MDIETLLKNPEKLKRLLIDNDSIVKRYESELKSKNIEIQSKNVEIVSKDLIIDQQNKEIQRQENRILVLEQVIFSRKTEKVIRESSKQNLLFDEAETFVDRSDVEVKEVKSYNRKKAGRKPIPDNIPREEVINDLSDEEKTCSCGCKMQNIGTDTKEELEYIPAKIYVRKTITPKYVCRSCAKKKPDVEVKKAVLKTIPLIERSIVTPSLLASILYQKFFLALPFYRQSKMFGHMGINISRTDMCNWTITIYEKYLKDFCNLFWKEILTSKNIQIDETAGTNRAEVASHSRRRDELADCKAIKPNLTKLIPKQHRILTQNDSS